MAERFCQDPLESFFGIQRSKGGRNDNPTVKEFLSNTTSIRIQQSAATAPFRGNCRRGQKHNINIDDTPLPKRKYLKRQ
jgi:hypothetical protein